MAHSSMNNSVEPQYNLDFKPNTEHETPMYWDSLYTKEPPTKVLTLEENIETYLPSSSYLKSYTTQECTARESIFQKVPSEEGALLNSTIQQQVWFLPLILLMLTLYGWVNSTYSKALTQDFKEFFYPQNRSDFYTSSVSEISRVKILLTTLSIFSIALFCYFSSKQLFSSHHGSFLYTYLSLLGIITAYMAFKLISIRVICYVFFDYPTWVNIKRTYSTLTSSMSIGLFILSIIVAYANDTIAAIALYAGLVICGIAVLLYLYKFLSIFFTGIASIFYLILYLCTLEILPSVALVFGLMSVV
ncbi:MAG: DUF4271 domain-containing protein [Paludibacteraceae bacterium]|nr:DUF4271 domain-containing protein [Paludibacteraceae bacterium]MEE3482718.1 DUF4271 domain-containing protein [Bacteroidales bacterium]